MASVTDVRKNLEEAFRRATNKNKYLAVVGLRMIRDAVKESPHPPLKTGFLRGSGAVFVGQKKVADSKTLGENKGSPPSSNDNPVDGEVLMVFDTPYAARMDQKMEPKGNLKSHFLQDQGIGGGFISSKIANPKNRATYAEIIANEIKKELG